MTIQYLCPDYPNPSGGVKRIYTHVEILRRNGLDAQVVHLQPGFKPDWFDSHITPANLAEGLRMGPDDRLVVPDSMVSLLPQLPDCPKVVLVLNPFYLLQVEEPTAILGLLGHLPLVTNSRSIADFLSWIYSRNDIALIRTGVDREIFFPGEKGERVRIAFTRRKDTASDAIILLLRQHMAERDMSIDLTVLDIEDLSLNDYAAMLRSSHIWLTTSLHHGFPRSTLEAMACGCLCMGYTGACGADLIIPSSEGGMQQNFIPVPDGDVFGLTRTLSEAVRGVQRSSPGVGEIVEASLETAAQHTLEREEQSVLDFWQEMSA